MIGRPCCKTRKAGRTRLPSGETYSRLWRRRRRARTSRQRGEVVGLRVDAGRGIRRCSRNCPEAASSALDRARATGGRRDDVTFAFRPGGIEAVDRALGAERGQHQQIARSIDREIDRIERRIAHDLQPRRRAPAIDALEAMLDEIELARGIDRRARDRIEAVLPASRTAPTPGTGAALRRRRAGVGRDVEQRELALAHFQLARHVEDRILEREFAGAQIGAAAIVVAGGEAALGVDMDVAEADVAANCTASPPITAGLKVRVTR